VLMQLMSGNHVIRRHGLAVAFVQAVCLRILRLHASRMQCTCTLLPSGFLKVTFALSADVLVSECRLAQPELASRKVEIVLINHIQLLGVHLTSENSLLAEMRRKRWTDVMVIATVASQDTVRLVIRIPLCTEHSTCINCTNLVARNSCTCRWTVIASGRLLTLMAVIT